mgnify:CR=1 FL=1
MPSTLSANFEDVHTRRGEFNVTVRTNLQELREDRETLTLKPTDVFWIIVLRNFYGSCYDVERGESFHQIVEDLLVGTVEARKVEVVNMGIRPVTRQTPPMCS